MRACGRAGVRACGRAGVRACGRAGVRACGRAGVRACGRAGVRACGRACVPACRACVRACGRACGRAGVRACGRAGVRACGRAGVRAGMRAGGRAGVRACGRAIVQPGGQADTHRHTDRKGCYRPHVQSLPAAAAVQKTRATEAATEAFLGNCILFIFLKSKRNNSKKYSAVAIIKVTTALWELSVLSLTRRRRGFEGMSFLRQRTGLRGS